MWIGTLLHVLGLFVQFFLVLSLKLRKQDLECKVFVTQIIFVKEFLMKSYMLVDLCFNVSSSKIFEF